MRKLHDMYVINRRKKIVARLTEIEVDLSNRVQSVKALRMRRDSLVCCRSTMEQHDEFTRSTISLLNDEIKSCVHAKAELVAERIHLETRLEGLPVASLTRTSAQPAYSS